MKTKQLIIHIGRLAASGKYSEAANTLEAWIDANRSGRVQWERDARGKTVAFLRDCADGVVRPRYEVFGMDGNGKLPYVTFSALPVATCPGMGACGSFCYSFKGWRYPSVWGKQIQNMVLLRESAGRSIIRNLWEGLPEGRTVRLYVDGDFDSAGTLEFWMAACTSRPDLSVYGYSKSWALFLARDDAGKEWPSNYTLNLSSGSRYGDAYLRRMEALACVRGEFSAVRIGREHRGMYRTVEYNRAVRIAAQSVGMRRVFVCPGKCGDCANGSHACGNPKFKGVPIVIAVH